GTDWAQVGAAISLPRTLEAVSTADIARDFGEEFAAGLAKLSPGDWSGPLPSGFGSHLIRLREVDPGKAARLADVRQQVENDWRSATQKAREAKAYQALLDGYTIQIAKP
ncbi:MAG: peptidyl-prolyl cis-trans isomerase, partial [Sphingorhabdus sp.]|nr:peptidyl-prolyl cis-trans isomerase [Sphingorhabdus sp.]